MVEDIIARANMQPSEQAVPAGTLDGVKRIYPTIEEAAFLGNTYEIQAYKEFFQRMEPSEQAMPQANPEAVMTSLPTLGEQMAYEASMRETNSATTLPQTQEVFKAPRSK